MLDLLEDFMTLRNIAYARLDGSTPRPRRTLDIKLVGEVDVLILHCIDRPQRHTVSAGKVT